HAALIQRANVYIEKAGGLEGLKKRYGIDKTFVVPILTNYALAGLIDWKFVSPLPFELACVPQSWYRFVGMPVVSYAIPALVSIGCGIPSPAPIPAASAGATSAGRSPTRMILRERC